MNRVPFLIFGLVVLVAPLISADECFQQEYLTPGVPLTLSSPGFPYNFWPGINCTYQVIAPVGYKVNMVCSTMTLYFFDYFVISQTGSASPKGATDPYYTLWNGAINSNSAVGSNKFSFRIVTASSSGRYQCVFTTQVDYCACGRHQTGGYRITGGVEAGQHEYPYQALMVWKDESETNENKKVKPLCGGAVIHPRYVLTAAHCIVNRDASETWILVGEHDLLTDDSFFTQLYAIALFTPHASYNSGTNEHDIGLIRTTLEMQLNYGVGIVCLPWYGYTELLGPNVTVAGWGSTEFGGPMSNVLRKADMTAITNAVCGATYSQTTSNLNFLCTTERIVGADQDTCQFDSGTSVYREISQRIYSVGVTSGGYGCGGAAPTLNTRVTSYLSWITANSPGATYCQV